MILESYVVLPTVAGESLDNRDTLIASAGLRYGLTAKTELYTRISGLSSWQRESEVSRTSSSNSSRSRFADAKAGVNYQFKDENRTPALSGFAELTLSEKQRYSRASVKSAMFGLTTWQATDPVVFSFTGAYSVNLPRNDGGQRYRPGNLLLLHPAVAFAVNDRVTLSGGVQWTWREADQRAGFYSDINRSNTDLLLSVGYGLTRGNIINSTFKLNAAGDGGAQLWLNWLYTFVSQL